MTQLIGLEDVTVGNWSDVRCAVHSDVWGTVWGDVRDVVLHTIWISMRDAVGDDVWGATREPYNHIEDDTRNLP